MTSGTILRMVISLGSRLGIESGFTPSTGQNDHEISDHKYRHKGISQKAPA